MGGSETDRVAGNRQGELKKSFPRWTRESRKHAVIVLAAVFEFVVLISWLLPVPFGGQQMPTSRIVFVHAVVLLWSPLMYWVTGTYKIIVSSQGIRFVDYLLIRWQDIDAVEEGTSKRKPPRRAFNIRCHRRNTSFSHEIITDAVSMDEIIALMEQFIPDKIVRSGR